MTAFDLQVFGRVQQVGFRRFALEAALNAGVTGYVENHSDSSVFIHVEGSHQRVYNFTQAIHRGSPWSNVEKVEMQDAKVQDFDTFVIK